MLKPYLIAGILIYSGLLRAAEPPVTAAAFTPDGAAVVVGSQRGIVRLSWPDFKQPQTLATQLAHVHDLAFSNDGRRLAAVGGRPAEAGGIELFEWPAASMHCHRTLGHDVFYQVAWRHDDDGLLVAGPDHSISLLNRDGELVGQVTGHSRDVTTVAMLDNDYFVSGSRDQTLRIWKLPGNELVRTLNNHTRGITDLALRPGSDAVPYVLASASEDRTVRLWWPVRGRLMRFAKLPSPALDIAWLPNGRAILAACADGHLRVIDPDAVTIMQDTKVSDSWLYTVAASPDSRHAFVGGAGGMMQAVSIRLK